MTHQPTDQNNLLAFVNDPENLKKAAEGSMSKRLEVVEQAYREETLASWQVKHDIPMKTEAGEDLLNTIRALIKEAEARAYKQGWDSAGGELIKNQEEIRDEVVKELERLHRHGGRDYDNAMDEVIDERISELRKEAE